MQFQLIYPSDFDAIEELVRVKGWFGALVVVAAGRTYRPVFYDFGRLAQEFADSQASGRVAYVEKNLVIVSTITKATIEAAVAQLAAAGFNDLVADECEQ